MVFKAIKRLIRWLGRPTRVVEQAAYDRETAEQAAYDREAAKLKRFDQELRTLERKDWSKELRKFVEWVEYMQTPEAFKRAKAENVVIIPSFEEDGDEPD